MPYGNLENTRLPKVTRYAQLNFDQPQRLPCNSKTAANIPTPVKFQVGGTATST